VQIVVLRYDANDSSGFWWEVKELIAGGIPPTRVLAWFPQDHHIPFDMFQVHFKELMPVTFPSTPDRQVQFVFFDEKWKPHLVIRGPKFLRWIAPVIDFDAFYFDSQLSPFFEQNQQSPPRLALRQTVIVGGAMLLSTALWVLFMTMPA